MSRIDEALKRSSGVVPAPAEARTAPVLDRYASEGPPKPAEPKRAVREDHGKIAAFEPVVTRPADVRPASVPVPGPAPARVAVAAPVAPPPLTLRTAHGHADQGADDDPLINYRQIFDYAGFAARSVLRHRALATITVVLVLALTGAALLILPKTYHVETKLLAQRNAVMAALSNPNRAVPWDADAPTRAAAETVLRRDNLIALINQTDLINDWNRNRAPVLRLKDWLTTKLTRHVMTPDDQLDALVGLLEVRMHVDAGPVGDGTVTISLDWPSAETGYRLVQGAQQAFLDARQVAETAAIGESIAILERYSQTLHGDIDRTLAELDKNQTREKASGGLPRSRVSLARRAPTSVVPGLALALGVPGLAASVDADPDLNTLKTKLTVKRNELARIEESRQRQLSDLQSRLAQLRTVYTADHPTVLSVQQNIASVSQDQPQSLALANEIEELQADYDKRVADATDLQIKTDLARRTAAAASAAVGGPPMERPVDPLPEPLAATPTRLDASSEFMTLRLRSELNQLESVLERTDGARIELAVSQAAFKYRYTVIRPAQVPRDAASPNQKMIVLAGLIASLFLALAIVVSKDLFSNRILESWQVEGRLGLPVLGTLRQA